MHKSGAWRSILFLKDNKKSVCYFNIIHPITILAQRNFAEIKYPIAYFSFFALFARKKLYELNRCDILFSTRNFVPFTINIFAKTIGNECEVKLSLTIETVTSVQLVNVKMEITERIHTFRETDTAVRVMGLKSLQWIHPKTPIIAFPSKIFKVTIKNLKTHNGPDKYNGNLLTSRLYFCVLSRKLIIIVSNTLNFREP